MIISKIPHARTLQVNPLNLLQLIQRRKLIIAPVVVLAVGLAGFLGISQRSQYSATATVALNSRTVQAAPQDAVVSRLPQESPVLRTEMDVITSRIMAEEVIRRIDRERLEKVMAEKPGFSPREFLASMLSKQPEAANQQSGDGIGIIRDRDIVDYLLSGLRVDNDGRSYTIFISFKAEDPVLTAQIANAYADAYLRQLALTQTSATRDVSQWLAKRVEELRARLELSERAVQSFRQNAELVQANGMTLQSNRLNNLNLELIQVRSERAGAEARLEIAKGLRGSGRGMDALGEVLRSPVIQGLRQQEAQLSRSVQDLQSSGAIQNIQLSSLKTQLSSVQQQMNDEMERIIGSLGSEVEVALRREKSVEDAIAEAWQKTAEESKAVVKLQQLEREANANRLIYESFLNRYKQTIEQEGYVVPEARLISKAELPTHSTGKNPFALLVFGMIGGCLGGLGCAFLVDRLDTRVRSGTHLQEITGAPIIGRIPALKWRTRVKPQNHILRMRDSGYSEGIRRLAVALSQSRFTNSSKVIVVTSPGRNDGKTSTCASLARAIALMGKSVLVIDADLYRPSISDTFGLEPTSGLNDLLAGTKGLDEILQQDEQSGAHFIGAQNSLEHPQLLLQSQAFRKLMSEVRERYDIVIVDTPPVSAAIDAALIGSQGDATLLIVRWGSTTEASVLSAVGELDLFGLSVSGIILNRVDARSRTHETRYLSTDYASSSDRAPHREVLDGVERDGAAQLRASQRSEARLSAADPIRTSSERSKQ